MLGCHLFSVFLNNLVSDQLCFVEEFLSYRFYFFVFMLVCQALAVVSYWNPRENWTKIHAGVLGGRNAVETEALQVYLTASAQGIECFWSNQPLTPPPPLAVARNCWQLIEFLGVDCVQLWVAQSILKQTWKEQWSVTHRLAVCAAQHCCSVQHSIISELWTGCYLWKAFMRSRKAHGVIILNGVHGISLLWNVWAFHVCSIRLSGSSAIFEGRISYKKWR